MDIITFALRMIIRSRVYKIFNITVAATESSNNCHSHEVIKIVITWGNEGLFKYKIMFEN